jgi:hypothetical protein
VGHRNIRDDGHGRLDWTVCSDACRVAGDTWNRLCSKITKGGSMTSEQKLLLKTLAEESDLAVTYAERVECALAEESDLAVTYADRVECVQALVHMRRVRDALASLVKEVTSSPLENENG